MGMTEHIEEAVRLLDTITQRLNSVTGGRTQTNLEDVRAALAALRKHLLKRL